MTTALFDLTIEVGDDQQDPRVAIEFALATYKNFGESVIGTIYIDFPEVLLSLNGEETVEEAVTAYYEAMFEEVEEVPNPDDNKGNQA